MLPTQCTHWTPINVVRPFVDSTELLPGCAWASATIAAMLPC